MKPTRKQAILAQCWECMGHYDDPESRDCENVNCPLYEYQPYRQLTPNYDKFAYNHKRKGLVLMEDTRVDLTEEQREKRRESLKKARMCK